MLVMIACLLLLMLFTGTLTWSHVGWMLLTIILVKPIQNFGKSFWTWWSHFVWLGFISGAQLAMKAGRPLKPEEKAELQRRLKAKIDKEVADEVKKQTEKNFVDLEGIIQP
jgi:hypothetical protein